jgi:potassium-dependent mechanosensitive channel
MPMLAHRTLNFRLVHALLGIAVLVWPYVCTAQEPSIPLQPPAAPAQATVPSTPSEQAPAPISQVTLPPEVAEPVNRLTKSIEEAENSLQRLQELEEGLSRLRIDVETILTDASATAEQLRPRLAAIRSQIDKLGPSPGKDQVESPAIASERARLNGEAAAIDGAIKATELTWLRARQLIERITVLRHALFTRNLFARLPSPLLPTLWRDVMHDAPIVAGRLSYLAGDWWLSGRQKKTELVILLAAASLLYLLLRWTASRLTKRTAHEGQTAPPFIMRAQWVAWAVPVRSLAGVMSALLIYGGIEALDLAFPPWNSMGTGILKAILLFSVMSALITTVLAPRQPTWRLVPLADASAYRICRFLQTIVAISAIDYGLNELGHAFFVPLAISVVQSFAVSITLAMLIIGLVHTNFTTKKAAATPPAVISPHLPLWLKLPLSGIAILIVAASLAGYVSFAHHIAYQLVATGLVILIGGLVYLAIRSLTREPAGADPLGAVLATRFGIDQPRRHQLAWLTELVLTFLLVICVIPLLLLQWGYSGVDIRDWFKALLFGLEIGQFKISLARILIGIVLFTALLFATRIIQRWLREQVLAQSRMDAGITHSIDTAIGYAGIAIAALVAISYAGFDITNLAIVAGALSVGIGFGLQSIVNNFVSGLILLIERPVKVGDWIVIGNEQGNVRRISVRATEIETFDGASLIVPNSELITGRVLNWTHRNLMGRAIVKVGVGYAADPSKVITILRKCADDHPLVLKVPEPKAAFDGFGASSLDFSLRFIMSDINRSIDVQSEIRIAILEAFRAEGIEIPYPQQDVHVRAVNGLARSLSEATSNRRDDASHRSAEPATDRSALQS